MNRRRVTLTVVLVVASAFLGGSLSSLFIVTSPALAADRSVPRIITAREFRLEDYQGRTRALLRLEREDEATLTLFTREEKPKIKFIVDSQGNASGHFWHRNAEINPYPRSERYPSINFWYEKNICRTVP